MVDYLGTKEERAERFDELYFEHRELTEGAKDTARETEMYLYCSHFYTRGFLDSAISSMRGAQ